MKQADEALSTGARVVVVGLGPGARGDITAAATTAIDRIRHRYLRTIRHPTADAVPEAHSFDALYERGDSFDDVYREIVETVVAGAVEHGEVLYAVPGSPLVGERTVELLMADTRIGLSIIPALSFLDLAWARLGIDPLAKGVRIVDGMSFVSVAAGDRGPLLIAQCHSKAVLSAIKLSLDTDITGPGPEVVVLQRLGLADELVRRVRWDDLDRDVEPDHLTSVYVETMDAPVAGELVALAELMQVLRAQCPWDHEQTHESLARYVVEEAYELAEAIDGLALLHAEVGADLSAGPDPVEHLQDELGDVLLQVVFHACLAGEKGWFTLADVARAQREKLVHRHPHVFPRESFDASALRTADDVASNWAAIKASSGPGRAGGAVAVGPMAGLAGNLPALSYAAAVLKRAEKAGVRTAGVDETNPTNSSDIGEQLLQLVGQARRLGVDAELALRNAAARLRDAVVNGSN